MKLHDKPVFSTLPPEDLDDDLLRTFAQSLTSTLAVLAASIGAADAEQTARLGHRAGGSAATCGFPELKRRLYALETMARSGCSTADLALFFRGVEREAERVLRGVEASRRVAVEADRPSAGDSSPLLP